MSFGKFSVLAQEQWLSLSPLVQMRQVSAWVGGATRLPVHSAARGFCFMAEKGVGTGLGFLPMCPEGAGISIPSSEHLAAGAGLGGAGPPRVQAGTLDCICLSESIKP